MRVDVILPADLPAAEMARLGRLAEGYGIGGVWVATSRPSMSSMTARKPLKS